MSDEDTTQDTEAQQDAPENDQDGTEQASPEDDRDDAWDPERARKKIAKTNSENKALRERATTAEKKAANVDDLARERDDLSAHNLRLEVGYELGLPLNLARRLQGSTKEEMVADAEALVELVSPAKQPSRKPQEALRGGLKPDAEPEETDLSKLGERMFRR